MTASPPETLIGRRLCDAAFGVYGHRAYLESRLAEHRLIAEDDGRPAPEWAPPGRVVTRANHLSWTLAAVRRQLGPGRLPCFMADVHEELRRVGPLLTDTPVGVWLLTHERLKGVARVRALVDTLTVALSEHVELLEGRHAISAS